MALTVKNMPFPAVFARVASAKLRWAGSAGRSAARRARRADVTGAVIGERWQIGADGVVLEVSSPRIPCTTFQGFMDEPHWVKRFTEHGAPGAYLRVVAEGTIGTGDTLTVVDRPDHGVTIGDVFRLRDTAADRLRRLLDQQHDLAADLDHAVRRDLTARAR